MTDLSSHSFTYLITGGAGFIGSHLSVALLSQGYKVLILDDLSSGKRTNIPAQAAFVQGDVTDGALMESLVAQSDGVFHLAAIASVDKSRTHWRDTSCVNTLGTVTVLEAIARQDTPVPCVYASSAAIYGTYDSVIDESFAAQPQTAYGVDKYASECHARIGEAIHGIASTGMRFFNVYGERQDPLSPYSGVISIFAQRFLEGLPVAIHGDGQQCRDFIYAGDVAGMLIAAMRQHHTQEHSQARVVNVCTGNATTIMELAGMLRNITDSDSAITHAPARAGDIYYSCGSPEYLHVMLGKQANMLLMDGLQRTVSWMQGNNVRTATG